MQRGQRDALAEAAHASHAPLSGGQFLVGINAQLFAFDVVTGQFTEPELTLLKTLAPLSLKPTLVAAEAPELNDAITQVLKKSGIIFFYTADKKEVHAWPVQQDSDIVTCAGKIHSDLARGFIKADIIKYQDFMQVYNMAEARTKGLVKLVDRDYTIHAGDIIEIRFNV